MRILFTLLLTYFSFSLNAQTSLSPGDLVILEVQADTPDDFAFATLVPIDAGTQIIFTDCGADADGFKAPTCGEGARLFTADIAYPAGRVFFLSINSDLFSTYTDGVITGSLGLSTGGDQLIAFQGTGSSPNFLYAVNLASTQFAGDKSDSNQTGLPAGLTEGVTAVAVGSGSGVEDEYDNAVYNGTNMPWPANGSSSFAGSFNASVLTDVGTPSNWIGANTTADAAYSTAVLNLQNLANNSILPVTLTSFQATAKGKSVELSWSTASEINNEGFHIQRSADGKNFVDIAFEKGAGDAFKTIEYSYLDESPLAGSNYYRLRQVDFDGTESFSEIAVVSVRSISVRITPKSTFDIINVETDADLSSNVKLINTSGQVIYQVGNIVGKTSIDLSSLPQGIYVVSVENTQGATTQKVIRL